MIQNIDLRNRTRKTWRQSRFGGLNPSVGPNSWRDVGSIYHDRKVGVENSEGMSLLWGHVEFEMPRRHPSRDII